MQCKPYHDIGNKQKEIQKRITFSHDGAKDVNLLYTVYSIYVLVYIY